MKGDFPDSAFLLKAVETWLFSALILLPAAAVVLNLLGASEQAMSITSSCISFFAALCAGTSAARKRRQGNLYTSFLSVAVLVTALLTGGYLIAGEKIDRSAVLSLVSFTFAGCLVGSVICYRPAKRHRRRTGSLT